VGPYRYKPSYAELAAFAEHRNPHARWMHKMAQLELFDAE